MGAKGMTDRNFKGAVDYMNFYFKEVEEPQLTYSGSEAVDNTDPGVSGIRGGRKRRRTVQYCGSGYDAEVSDPGWHAD